MVLWRASKRGLSLHHGLILASGVAMLAVGPCIVIYDRALPFFFGGLHRSDPWKAFSSGAIQGLLFLTGWALFLITPIAMDIAREREREQAALRLEVERMRVRAALEPHFVLNTLNAVASLVTVSPHEARTMIGDLGALLRDAVQLAALERHSVADEVAWLERYGRILMSRHQNRFSLKCTVTEEASVVLVPVLVFQPLVENAILHGALKSRNPGIVTVSFSLSEAALVCQIQDNGPGLPSGIRADAKGLALTRRRLEMDAPGSTLSMQSSELGTTAEVRCEVSV